jgi:hypothetical protein
VSRRLAWTRVPDSERTCEDCKERHELARVLLLAHLPKTRRGVWRVVVPATGQPRLFCGDCKQEFIRTSE